jgi:cardiolipin synthase
MLRLRPGPGRKLPPDLHPSRVGTLAGALPGGVRDPGFATLLERIDEDIFRSSAPTDIYFDGPAAFAAMLAAVAQARREVLLESYIFKDDPTGRSFQRELIAAAGRGVQVKVLADGFGSFETRRGFWQELEDGGVEARLYHPIGFPWRLLKFRDHRKILVADRRVAFTGGMNIGDEYGSSLLPRASLWRDTHARVEGPAAAGMAIVFEEAWREAGGAALPPLPPPEERTGARVLILDSRPGRGSEEVASAYASVLGAVRERLWITMAYFAPRRRALPILGGAARRGVDVRLLLPGKSDVGLVRHAGHGFFSDLLARGVRIFEYQAAILHAKTLVADGHLSVVGSSNLDFRSFELNAECNFLILDGETGARMEAAFLADLEHSREIVRKSWRGRGMLHRAGDHLARRLAPLL